MKKFFNKTPRQMLNENVIESFKKFVKETPNSILFWNGLLYVIFFGVWIFAGNNWAGLLSGIGSLLFLGIALDGDDDDHHYWIPLTFLFWFFIALMLMLGFFYLIFLYTIKPFNEWLDKPKKQKDGSNQTVC